MRLKNKYRIVMDRAVGYCELQVKLWYFPFCWFSLRKELTLSGAKRRMKLKAANAKKEVIEECTGE